MEYVNGRDLHQTVSQDGPLPYNTAARYVAQVATAPVMAAAVNSPGLFGRYLWEETRIAPHAVRGDPDFVDYWDRIQLGEEGERERFALKDL